MLKTLLRTLVILAVAIAIGWGSVLIIDHGTGTASRGGFQIAGRTGPGDFQGGDAPQPGSREGGEGGERGGFGLLGGLIGMAGRVVLFAVVTLIVVGIGRMLAKRSGPAEEAEV